MSMSEREYRHLDYRVKVLPQQLANTRRKLAALEAEARRYGLHDLIQHGGARQ